MKSAGGSQVKNGTDKKPKPEGISECRLPANFLEKRYPYLN
jgi:hypothetical protein